uniref:Uncharacterized protein n=1 Tax=Anguilla anguilla TaxID=7936 RepID=A0A0E9PF85_ANGAN
MFLCNLNYEGPFRVSMFCLSVTHNLAEADTVYTVCQRMMHNSEPFSVSAENSCHSVC